MCVQYLCVCVCNAYMHRTACVQRKNSIYNHYPKKKLKTIKQEHAVLAKRAICLIDTSPLGDEMGGETLIQQDGVE